MLNQTEGWREERGGVNASSRFQDITRRWRWRKEGKSVGFILEVQNYTERHPGRVKKDKTGVYSHK